MVAYQKVLDEFLEPVCAPLYQLAHAAFNVKTAKLGNYNNITVKHQGVLAFTPRPLHIIREYRRTHPGLYISLGSTGVHTLAFTYH